MSSLKADSTRNAFGPQPGEHIFSRNWLDGAGIDVIRSAIQILARLRQAVEEVRYHVAHNALAAASRVSRHLVKFFLNVGMEFDFQSGRSLVSY